MDRSRTKLVCTIGPASADRIGELVAAGMDVARINFSHGTPDDHRAYVHAVRAAAHSARRSVAVMVDLPGPKIRLGELESGLVTLETGAKFTLWPESRPTEPQSAPSEPQSAPAEPQSAPAEPDSQATDVDAAPPTTEPADGAAAEPEAGESAADTSEVDEAPGAPQDAAAVEAPAADDVEDTTGSVMTVNEFTLAAPATGNASGATVSTTDLALLLQVGDRVLLADGAAELRVVAISGSAVETDIVHGGTVRSRSGVNVPSSRLAGDGLTDDDRAAIPRALELRADLIAQSFVRTADDVRSLRAMLPADGPRIVAKIETRAAVDNFDEIAQVADGIMVARGDLG
ncbi:MAG: pyruvate kinase, partial [Candidatus Limnocylindrales bacterium]